MKQTYRIALHSLCILVLSVIFFKIIPYDPSNLPILGLSIDSDITDFYNSVANKRPLQKRDSNVVIVDIIGLTNRAEIAEALDLVSRCEPLAIGLDAVFDSPNNETEDQSLVNTILSIPNLVLASSLDPTSRSFFDNSIPLQNKGFINLGDDDQIIRRLYTDSICGTDTLSSFAAQIVRISGITPPRDYSNGDFILYPSLRYETLTIDEIPQKHDHLTGKLVLMGALNDYEDLFYTPIDLRMSGVSVHAHIISTILGDKKITSLDERIQWVVVLLVLFALISLRVYFMFYGNALGDFLLRIAQLFLVWLVVYIGYLIFIHYYKYCDISIALLTCISLLVADAWQAGIYIYGKIKK